MILSVQISLRMYSIYLIIIIIHNNYKLTSPYIYKRDTMFGEGMRVLLIIKF